MNEEMKVDSLNAKSSLTEFPSNSKINKEEVPVKKVQKVISGKVLTRKKSLSTKFAEIVMGEGSDMHSVIGYVVNDVLIPSAKSTISDMVNGGIEMLFFGTTSGKRNRSSGGRDRARTSYSNYYKDDYRDRDRDKDRDRDRDRDRARNKSRHNFDDIVIETRGEAEEVVEDLMNLIGQYDVASIADFYAMVDIASDSADQNFGWENLNTQNTYVERIRQGFIRHLPRPKSIK